LFAKNLASLRAGIYTEKKCQKCGGVCQKQRFTRLEVYGKRLLEAKDLDELEKMFKRWRRIGWKNIWLEESTPEKLKGEGGQ
jgi:Fe-S-cluster containining protein